MKSLNNNENTVGDIGKTCKQCGEQFSIRGRFNKISKIDRVKFCSPECCDKERAIAYRKLNPKTGFSSHVVGTIAEMKSSIYLFHRGYEVYRAISGGESCDLIVRKDGKCIAVEVTSGYKKQDGTVYETKSLKTKKWDVLLVVHNDLIIEKPAGIL